MAHNSRVYVCSDVSQWQTTCSVIPAPGSVFSCCIMRHALQSWYIYEAELADQCALIWSVVSPTSTVGFLFAKYKLFKLMTALNHSFRKLPLDIYLDRSLRLQIHSSYLTKGQQSDWEENSSSDYYWHRGPPSGFEKPLWKGWGLISTLEILTIVFFFLLKIKNQGLQELKAALDNIFMQKCKSERGEPEVQQRLSR